MLQRLFKIQMCWKWKQGIIVRWLPPFPARANHLTFSACNLHTNNTEQITTLSVAGGMTVREKAEMEIRIIS